MVPLSARPAKFFRLGPDDGEAIGGFAVRRGDAKARLDVNYSSLGPSVEERLARARYPIHSIGSLEKRLQYGCSKRADVNPVGLPILRMSNLQPDGWDLTELKYVELTDKERDLWRLEQGDILFNRTNSKELVGKCEVFKEPGEWVFASYLMRLTVDTEKASPEFVSAYLSSPGGRAQIERESRQIIGMTNINAEEIRTLRIPLPNPNVQAKLLAELNAARVARDADLASADAALEGLDTSILNKLGLDLPTVENASPFAIRHTDLAHSRIDTEYHSPRFRRLRAMIEAGPFDAKPIREICLPLITGFAAGGDNQSEEAEGVPHLRPTNITAGGEVSLTGSKFVPLADVGQNDEIKADEVLFNNTNSSLWVGKSAVFDLPRPCACSNHMTRLRLLDPKSSSTYLAAFLNALRSVGYFSALATNFNNQAGISSDALGALKIPVPSSDVQMAIAKEVDKRRSEATRLRAVARERWKAARQAFEEALLGRAL